MSNEACRKAFETWAVSKGLEISMRETAWGIAKYKPTVQRLWECWVTSAYNLRLSVEEIANIIENIADEEWSIYDLAQAIYAAQEAKR